MIYIFLGQCVNVLKILYRPISILVWVRGILVIQLISLWVVYILNYVQHAVKINFVDIVMLYRLYLTFLVIHYTLNALYCLSYGYIYAVFTLPKVISNHHSDHVLVLCMWHLCIAPCVHTVHVSDAGNQSMAKLNVSSADKGHSLSVSCCCLLDCMIGGCLHNFVNRHSNLHQQCITWYARMYAFAFRHGACISGNALIHVLQILHAIDI